MSTEPAPPAGVGVVAPQNQDVARADYLRTRGWLYADRFALAESGEASFGDEAALWQAALAGRGFYETRRLVLKEVVLTDWLPRSPGRYHTREAWHARGEAQSRIAERHGDHVVYSPDGKTSMVQGGVGCLRLAAKQIGGQRVKFLGATTSGVVHRGFVVALDEELYGEIAAQVDHRGGVRCTGAGTIRYWRSSEPLDFFMAKDVPRVYLGVDQLHPAARRPDDVSRIDVTPAVTFASDGREFFAYSHFRPGDPGDVARAAGWLSHYVVERHRGRVLTDFDELVPRFADTAAPLRELMDVHVPVDRIAAELHASGRMVTIIKHLEVTMGDRYSIRDSQVGAVGPGATASDNTFVQQQAPAEIDLEALAAELARLRATLRERGTEAEQDLAVGEVAAAEVAAKQGDAEGALRHLKLAGQWALGVATEIGVPVATAALKSVLGS
jgi:hypothetical protein